MRHYQDSGKSNCRKGKTEHVTSPVANAGRDFVLPRDRADKRRMAPSTGDIYEVFHLVEGRFASASATAAYPNDRQVDVRSWTGLGYLGDTSPRASPCRRKRRWMSQV